MPGSLRGEGIERVGFILENLHGLSCLVRREGDGRIEAGGHVLGARTHSLGDCGHGEKRETEGQRGEDGAKG